MTGIERRIKELEKRTDTSEPIAINIRKTVIGMDGKVARVEEEAVTIGGAGGNREFGLQIYRLQ